MTESVKTDDSQDGTLSFCKQNGRPCQHPYCFCDKGTGLILDPASLVGKPVKSNGATVGKITEARADIQPYDPYTW